MFIANVFHFFKKSVPLVIIFDPELLTVFAELINVFADVTA